MPLETSEWFRSVSRPIYWIWMGWKNDAKKVAERPVVAEYDGIEYQMRILACVFFWYVIFIPTPPRFKWHQMQYKCNRTTPRPRGQKRPILWMSHAQLPNVGRAQSQCKTVFWCSKVKHSDTYIYIHDFFAKIHDDLLWWHPRAETIIFRNTYRITCFAPDFANWNLLTSSDPNSGCRCGLRIDSMASEVHVELLHVPFSNAERRLSWQLGWMFQK